MARYIGETVTVDGIFVGDPVPILVTELDFVRINAPMPEDQYVILAGAEVDRIDPQEYGGAKLRVKGTVELLDTDEGTIPTVRLIDISYELLDRLTPYAPEPIEMDITESPAPDKRRYAILFSGGIDATNNAPRYWNDLTFMYKALIGPLGFPKENIAVLYADGSAVNKSMPVDYSATEANLVTVFGLLRKYVTKEDLVFFFTTNHGGGFNTNDPLKQYIYGGQVDANGDEPSDAISEATFKLDLNSDGDQKDVVSWDEGLYTWGGEIFDDAFHTIVSDLDFHRMVIVMEQCHSGGLIHDMAQGGNRIIISAAGEYEPSYGMSSGSYNEFSYYFTCAINKADPDGNKVDADTDKNGHVSLVEAFNYARSKDTKKETPWYEDSGDGIPHSGVMPAQGDGKLGASTTLEP